MNRYLLIKCKNNNNHNYYNYINIKTNNNVYIVFIKETIYSFCYHRFLLDVGIAYTAQLI